VADARLKLIHNRTIPHRIVYANKTFLITPIDDVENRTQHADVQSKTNSSPKSKAKAQPPAGAKSRKLSPPAINIAIVHERRNRVIAEILKSQTQSGVSQSKKEWIT
jgi:hypothetical protein